MAGLYNTPKTAYGAAIGVIREAMIKQGTPVLKVNRTINNIVEKYSSDEIIRVADAILRFGLENLRFR